MSWEVKFGIKASCKGCGEEIFPKSKVLIRCVICTQQLTAAAGLTAGNNSEEDGSLSSGLDTTSTGQIGNPLPSDSTMDLCPDCFAGKVEIGNHKSTHNYQFIDGGGFPIFPTANKEVALPPTIASNPATVGSQAVKTAPGKWTAREHLFLLTAIERHGYGNWEDISKAINVEMNLENKASHPNYRTPSAVMEEYTNIFLHGIIGQMTLKEGMQSSTNIWPINNCHISPNQIDKPSTNFRAEELSILGYLPLRNEFKIEHGNDAESLVSQLQYQPILPSNSIVQGSTNKNVSQGSHSTSSSLGCNVPNLQDDDDSVDQELKVAHIEMYKMKLRERERRRRVAREHQLVNQFFRENPLTYDGRGRAVCLKPANSEQQKSNKKNSSQRDGNNSDLMERLKILAEFQGVSEYQAFMASITKEREIKHRIKDLMRFRRYGIKSLSESLEYEVQQRTRRINRKKSEKLRNQPKLNSLLQSNNSTTNVESPLGSITSFEQSGWGSSVSVATPSSAGADVQSPASSIKSEDYLQQAVTASPSTPLTLQTQNFSPMPHKMHLDCEKSINSPQAQLASIGSFTISTFPGHEILSVNEKRLCTNLRLTPAHYISYKTCLLTNHLQKKKGQTPKPLNPSGLDKNDRKVIFNFLMRAGWITAY